MDSGIINLEQVYFWFLIAWFGLIALLGLTLATILYAHVKPSNPLANKLRRLIHWRG